MKQVIFVGNYSKQGINTLEFSTNNNLKHLFTTGHFINNSYICKYKNYLYSVVEIEGDEKVDSGYVVAYEIKGNELSLINTCISYGKGPCFLVVDESRQILYVANYIEGSFVALKLEENGAIGKKLFYKKFTNTSNIHHIQFSNDYKNLYVIDLGSDCIFEYEITYNGMELDLTEKSLFQFPELSEPRHMSLDEQNNIYIVTEKSCELYKLNHDKKSKLTLVDKISILPNQTPKKQNYTGCAIKMDYDLHYLYVSVRGHNSISVFDINNNDMKLIQNINCQGDGPRDITLDKYKAHLLCANQLSNNISIFNIKNGILTYQNQYEIATPSCIIIA